MSEALDPGDLWDHDRHPAGDEHGAPDQEERWPYQGERWTDRLAPLRTLALPRLPAPVVERELPQSGPDFALNYAPTVKALRWLAIGVTGLLSLEIFWTDDRTPLICSAVVIGHHLARLLRPLDTSDGVRAMAGAFLEMLIVVLSILLTGIWSSPLLGSLAVSTVIIAFGRGSAPTARLLAAALVALFFSTVFGERSWVDIQRALPWSVVLFLVVLVSGYARRVSTDVVKDHSLTLDRVDRLSDANNLLTSLHRVALNMSTSLDQAEVVEKTFQRLRFLVPTEISALLLFDETDAHWDVLHCAGTRLPKRYGPSELVPPLRTAVTTGRLNLVPQLLGQFGPGVASSTSSGIYAPLIARGEIIGLIALERAQPRAFNGRDIEVVNGFVPSVALALDNARVFRKIRTVGADEERNRIARDLHDRMGQSLAYLAFELDRLTRADNVPTEVQASISGLSDDVRHVIREVRDTLYDLRTDVSEARDMSSTLEDYLERVRVRSDLECILDCDGDDRLPLNQERELWRIAQEAVRNVERHAEAKTVTVRYSCDGRRARVEIVDDGKGFTPDSGRDDSYGMLGMRERAASIGAQLDVLSELGAGTSITCRLDPSAPNLSVPRETT